MATVKNVNVGDVQHEPGENPQGLSRVLHAATLLSADGDPETAASGAFTRSGCRNVGLGNLRLPDGNSLNSDGRWSAAVQPFVLGPFERGTRYFDRRLATRPGSMAGRTVS